MNPLQPVIGRKRGRASFRRYRALLKFLSVVFRLLPQSLRQFAWLLSNSLPGNMGAGVRYAILLATADRCGENILIGRNVELLGQRHLRVGNNVSIHAGCYIDASGGVTIEDEVSIAHHTSILSTNHTWDDFSLPIRDNPMAAEPVVIARDVWVGCGCRIMPGTTIRPRTVVAAGAVVARGVYGPGVIIGGVPAKPLKPVATITGEFD